MRKSKGLFLLICLLGLLFFPLSEATAVATQNEYDASRARVKQNIYVWNKNLIHTTEQKIVSTLRWLEGYDGNGVYHADKNYFWMDHDQKARFLANCRQSECSVFVEAIADADGIRSTNEAADYYYYKSQKAITDYLATAQQSGYISLSTNQYIYGFLREAGYYGMTTPQKCQFLLSHMPVELSSEHNNNLWNVLNYVARAENLQCSTPSDTGNYTQNVSAADSQAFMQAIQQNSGRVISDFYYLYTNVCKTQYVEQSSWSCFSDKSKWSDDVLKALYNSYFKDFKDWSDRTNYPIFTSGQIKRLEVIWGGMLKQYPPPTLLQKVGNTASAVIGGIGKFLGPDGPLAADPNDPMAVLMAEPGVALAAEPVEILAGLVKQYGRAAVVKVLGEKVFEKPGTILAAAYKVPADSILGQWLRKRSMGAVKYVEQGLSYGFTYVDSRYLGRVTVDLNKMFGRSGIPRGLVSDIATTMVATLSRIYETSFAKYVPKDAVFEALSKTEVVLPDVVKVSCGERSVGVCTWKRGSNLGFEKILVDRNYVTTNKNILVSNTYAHEFFHSLASRVRGASEYARGAYGIGKNYVMGGYANLEEGWTDYMTKLYMKEAFGVDSATFRSGYPRQREVVGKISEAISRRYNDPTMGDRVLKQLYGQATSIDQIDDYLGVPGAMKGIASLMKSDNTQNYKAVNNYLSNLYR